jgi:hypothetical protein
MMPLGMEVKEMSKQLKKQWSAPTVSQFDIAERTQADPFPGDDFATVGGSEPDQNGGGNGGGNGGAPGS